MLTALAHMLKAVAGILTLWYCWCVI